MSWSWPLWSRRGRGWARSVLSTAALAAAVAAGLALAPGAARSLLGDGPRHLRDRAVPLRDLWGRCTEELLSDLGRATSWRERT